MPYRSRELTASAWFHVFSRGADRQDIYSLDGDHALFEALLAETVERFGIEVHAFALMSNHFHLLIHDPNGELSAAMQYLLSRYAKRYNHRTNRSGPLFDQRFGCVAIEADDDGSVERHLAIAARYVHRNPLAFVPPGALGAYRHSSLGVYLQRRTAPCWLSTNVLSALIDPRNYLQVVTETERADFVGALTWNWHPPVDAESLRDAVERRGERNLSGRSATRTMLITLALELRVATVQELALLTGVSMETVRRVGRRGRVRLVDDPTFAQWRLDVLDHLVAVGNCPRDTRGQADSLSA